MPCTSRHADLPGHDGILTSTDPNPSTRRNVAAPDAVACERCEGTVNPIACITTVRGALICAPCRRARYRLCEVCGGWNRDDVDCGNDCDEPDDDYDDEDEDGEDDGDGVYDYEYKPFPVFHGSGPLFLGLELEVETPVKDASRCVNIANSRLGTLGYLKADTSINHGFEVVTHPMSYAWAMAHFPWPMLGELRDANCVATPDIGIHVHLSRAGFVSACHVYRWMKFIYRNQPQVTALARRSSPEWAAFTDDDRRAARAYAKGGRGARHRAINTANTATFELRVFASSLDTGQVQAALAFASASVQYTQDLSVHSITQDAGWTWDAFAGWLDQHPAYRPLTRELEVTACAC